MGAVDTAMSTCSSRVLRRDDSHSFLPCFCQPLWSVQIEVSLLTLSTSRALLFCLITMAAIAEVDTDTPMMEDGQYLQQETTSLRQTITQLTKQLRAAESEKSDAVTRLQIVEKEKWAIAAQL